MRKLCNPASMLLTPVCKEKFQSRSRLSKAAAPTSATEKRGPGRDLRQKNKNKPNQIEARKNKSKAEAASKGREIGGSLVG